MTKKKTTKSEIFAPQMSWVKNGTSSARHDRALSLKLADSKKRRAEEDQKFQIAQKNPSSAKIHQHKLGSRKEHPSAVLAVKHPKDGSVNHWMICEITQDPNSEEMDLMLMMQCPRCIYTHGRPPEEVIMHIRQSNRMWHLDTRRKDERKLNPITRTCAGEIWVNPEDKSEVVFVAGTVTTDDWCKCPLCSWEFKIDDSVVHTRAT